ncbi:collagen-like triple helix repeat-containing protein [Alcaligenes sp. SDU_A2]|uniref:collagen-like triple helix repeat-containing protein n=1 Tax=Alcaligenes sp. SDU_A2 TaxID=3136634 RepID=UPI00311D881B
MNNTDSRTSIFRLTLLAALIASSLTLSACGSLRGGGENALTAGDTVPTQPDPNDTNGTGGSSGGDNGGGDNGGGDNGGGDNGGGDNGGGDNGGGDNGGGDNGGGDNGGGDNGGGDNGGGDNGGGDNGGGDNGGGDNGGGDNGGGDNGGGDNGGGDNGGGDNGGGDNGGGQPPISTSGPLKTTLGNVGNAVDNVLPLDLQETGGKLGQALDTVVEPVVDTATGLTQQLGNTTGLGEPINGLLNQTGGVVANLGEQLGKSNLPLNLGQGVGGLLTGLGNAVGSAGGLLHAHSNNPAPLTAVLGNASGGVVALTDSLLGKGSLLYPLTGPLGLGGLLNSGEAAPILEPALANAGLAVDNLIPLGLSPILGKTGESLDVVVAPLGATVSQVTQQVGDGLGVGQPIDALLGGVGSVLNQTGTALDSTAGLGLGGLLSGLGDTVASAGGLLHATQDNPNPLGTTLNHATGAVASLTAGLGGGDANGGLLAPVTNLVGGLTGSSPQASGTPSTNTEGLLAPVTGLLGGLLGGAPR